MHDSRIAQEVLDLAAERRGDRPQGLDGGRTALVVIDLQNVFMLPGMPIEVPTAREIVPNVNRLAAAMREAGGTVAWVQMSTEGQAESWSVFFQDICTEEGLREMLPGSHGFELHAGLEVHEADLRIRKTRYSAFIQGSSDIDAQLRARGIDTVVIVGTLTNVCCESSARDAMMLNYRVVFVEDANAALSDAEHNATLTTICRVFGEVVSTDQAVARLAGAGKALAAAE